MAPMVSPADWRSIGAEPLGWNFGWTIEADGHSLTYWQPRSPTDWHGVTFGCGDYQNLGRWPDLTAAESWALMAWLRSRVVEVAA